MCRKWEEAVDSKIFQMRARKLEEQLWIGVDIADNGDSLFCDEVSK